MLALFSALIGPYFVDWGSYRTAFETEASRILGQPVKVRGSADARLLPFPSLTFSDVAVGEGADGQPMMTIDRFSMDAELAPFLRGEVLIFDMRVDNPTATVRILPDGTIDWALKHRPATPGETVVLEKVTVSDARIRLVDDQNGRTQSLEALNAVMSARSLSGPWLIDGTASILGQSGAFSISTGTVAEDGSVRMRLRLSPDGRPMLLEAEGDARIADSKPRYDGGFTLQVLQAAQSAATEVKPLVVAKGSFEADNERLRIPDYRMEIGTSADPYVVTGEATIDTGPKPEFLILADGQQVDMDRLAADAGEADAPPVAAAVPLADRIALLRDLISQLPPPPLPGRVSIALPAVVAGDTTVRDVAIDARPDGDGWQIDKLTVNLPGRTTVEASGRLDLGQDTGFAGSLVVASSQPSGLSNWLSGDVDLVIRRLPAAGFSANVNLTSRLQRFEGLEVAVGPAILKGRLERQSPESGPPSLSVELAGDTFDVDAIRALVLLAGGKAQGAESELFASHNISGRIRAGRLAIDDVTVGGFDSVFVWKDGDLALERLAFEDLAGAAGSFRGQVGGSLVAPVGELAGRLTAATADGLFALARKLSGGHGVIERLAANSMGYDDLTLDLKLGFNSDSGPDLSLSGTAGGGQISVQASGAGLMPDRGGARQISVKASNPAAWRLLEQAGFAVLPLDGYGPAELEMSLTAGAQSSGVKDNDMAIVATLTAPDFVMSANGNGSIPANGPMTGRFSLGISAGDAEPMLTLFGQAPPRTEAGLVLETNAALEMTGTSLVLSEMEGVAGGNAFSGALSFDRQAAELSASGELKLDEADLAWLSELVLGPESGAAGEGNWSASPFLAPVPGGPRAALTLEVGRFDMGRAGSADGLTTTMTLAPGALTLADVKAGWLGGRLSGEMSLNNPDGTAYLSGRLAVDGADFARALGAIGTKVPARAAAGLQANIEGSGGSMQQLVGSLSGGGQMVLDSLTLEGIHTGALSRILGAVDQQEARPETAAVSAIVTEAMGGGEVGARHVVMPFSITGGVQRFAPVSISDEHATMSADGRIDLASLRIDAGLQLTFEPGVEAVAGSDPSVTFRVEGLVSDPGVSLDATALTNYLSVRAFERERRKVELLQAGVLEKQRMRRELSLLAERADDRAAEARRKAEAEAARKAAEAEAAAAAEAEAARKAEEERAARLAAEEAAAKAAAQAEIERQADEKKAAQAAAEAAAAREAEEARKAEAARALDAGTPGDVSRQPAPAPGPGAEPMVPTDPNQLDFRNLPGVEDPIRNLIAPN
ncbi:AsmA-like protein [Hoeflea marina]|uniref:AsmA-like protein n=1 Tax=Hoeflea marina TaxID=274592 RepID=A0A317PM76_9HYPH|nr:AsmA-like protein [Hoeflea marina]